jgi:hypothetical protein
VVNRSWFLILLSASLISALIGCSSNSTFNVQNPPPPPPNNVSIAFAPAPPSAISILPNPLPTLSATVTNDSMNAGVDWELAVCQSDGTHCNANLCAGNLACGNLYLSSDSTKTQVAHSASADQLTYQPPSSFFTGGNTMHVQVLAFATADHTKNTLSPINITAFGNVLNGTYVFQAQGSAGGSPYQIAGVLTLDGNGTGDPCSGFITAGEQTLNAFSVSVTSPILGTSGSPCAPGTTSSSYFVGPDGRGTITLNLDDPNNPGSILTENFTFSVLSSSKALIAELDSNSATGTLELQDPIAAGTLPTGGYAMAASGSDAGGTPVAFGAVLNIDNNPSAGGISGKGSLANQDYYFVGPSNCGPPKGFAGSTVSPLPGSTVPGAVVFNLVSNCLPNPFEINQLTGYVVDATHIRLIETDNIFFTAGPAIGQGSATGTFGVGSFSGPFVFGAIGEAPVSFLPSSFTSVGVICPDGAGTLNTLTSCAYTTPTTTTYGGFTDTLFLADNAPLPGGQNSLCQFAPCPGAISAGFSGTYQADLNGIGSIHIANLAFNPPPTKNNLPHPDIHFYLTGPPGSGSPALLLYAEIGGTQFYPALATGIAYPQQQPASALSFGNPELYGVSFTQQSGSENDGSGRMTASATGTAGTLAGTVDDLNNIGTPLALTDTFTPPADNFGRVAGTFLAPQQTPPATAPAVEYYFVDPDHGFFVEMDLLAGLASGSLQVTLGSFAKGCDVTSATDCQLAAEKSSGKRAQQKTRLRVPRRN